MTQGGRPGATSFLAVIAAIGGSPMHDVAKAFDEALRQHPHEARASHREIQALISYFKTRLGLAPAVELQRATELGNSLDALVDDGAAFTKRELATMRELLRHTPEHVPTVDRAPVVLPPLPQHQTQMWQTLVALEQLDRPWVLVGGQMTMLHCLENDHPRMRATDDGDVVVGVWTRRDALRATSRLLRDQGFAEVKTADGYGYRFARGAQPTTTSIDLLLPEGMTRQRRYPATSSGRRGFATDGGNQALSRAERVPVLVGGDQGFIRRPTLLGALVAKSHAYLVDSRDKDRHAQDIVALAEIALRDPRATLREVRPADRKPMRRFVQDKTSSHRVFRGARNPDAVLSLLQRLGGADSQS